MSSNNTNGRLEYVTVKHVNIAGSSPAEMLAAITQTHVTVSLCLILC